MTHLHRFIILTAAFCATVTSCQETGLVEPLSGGMVEDRTAPISLGMSEQGITRGYNPLTTPTIADIGVYAGFSEAGQDFDATTHAASGFGNAKFSKGNDGKWHGSTPRYWPITGSLSLFAYAPYRDDITVAPSYTGGPLALSFTPDKENTTGQTDMCVAAPVFNGDKTAGVQSLEFRHATAMVLFYGNYSGTPPSPNFFPQIDRIEIGGLIGTKTLTFGSVENPAQFSWEPDGSLPHDATYTLERSRNEVHNDPATYPLPKKADNLTGINLSDLNGRLFMVPQTLTEANTLKIYWSFMQKSGSSWVRVSQFVSESHLPYGTGAPVWQAGKTVIYHMTLDMSNLSEAAITATVTDWLDSGNQPQGILIE